MFSAIDECSEENNCDDVATCSDTLFSYTCKCKREGFHDLRGDGTACTGQNKTVQLELSIAGESRINCPATLLTKNSRIAGKWQRSQSGNSFS